jgi:phosphatidylinositol-4,5-bisphosphate 3-kinase
VYVIFKAGDDMRQDQLVLSIFGLMEKMWHTDKLELPLQLYRCIATSPMTGILEVVPNAVTTADIHYCYGVFGALHEDSFVKWLQHHNPEKEAYDLAVEMFGKTCAGYCVATHVMGIGDRHNDNIMVS